MSKDRLWLLVFRVVTKSTCRQLSGKLEEFYISSRRRSTKELGQKSMSVGHVHRQWLKGKAASCLHATRELQTDSRDGSLFSICSPKAVRKQTRVIVIKTGQ